MAGFESLEHIMRAKWVYARRNTNLIAFKTRGQKRQFINCE
jgi:hypothetical protein